MPDYSGRLRDANFSTAAAATAVNKLLEESPELPPNLQGWFESVREVLKLVSVSLGHHGALIALSLNNAESSQKIDASVGQPLKPDAATTAAALDERVLVFSNVPEIAQEPANGRVRPDEELVSKVFEHLRIRKSPPPVTAWAARRTWTEHLEANRASFSWKWAMGPRRLKYSDGKHCFEMQVKPLTAV